MSRAFTLIELLIVIVVIGLLIGAIAMVGGRAMYYHKVTYTETIMRTVTTAIEQFATENPLRNIYDRKDAATFGPYPPYMLFGGGPGAAGSAAVAEVLEPYASYSLPPSPSGYVLADRVRRDFGKRQNAVGSYSTFTTADGNDDIRALYTYLKVYSSAALAQIPQDKLKPLTGTAEYVNPTGAGCAPGTAGLIDVLGIYDAWDVPLDYFLYVKLEWSVLPDGSAGWRVTERRPVLRSRGITLDEYKAEAGGTDPLDPGKWIFSEPFPSPVADSQNANFKGTGILTSPGSTARNGWARALAPGDDPNVFGYVP